MNSDGPWLGTDAAPDVQGKDSEKHHVQSALNIYFAESRMGSRQMGRLINFIKYHTGKKCERRLPCVISKL